MNSAASRVALVLTLLVTTASGLAFARSKKPAAPAEAEPAPADAPDVDSGPKLHPVIGPAEVDLGHDLVIKLPEGFVLFEKEEAAALLREDGNIPGDDLVALVTKPKANWFVDMAYAGEGYIKDDDAAKLDNDEILDNIREGTKAANEYRAEKGFPPLNVDGWTEPPVYKRDVHHLVWGIRGSSSNGVSVNQYTRVLGRRGYASLNLVTGPESLVANKPELEALLAATSFKSGARYADFNRNTDKVSEYGLAALVAGGAGVAALKIAKMGLLAKFGFKILAVLLAAKKLVVVGLIALAAGIKKLLGLRKSAPSAAAGPPAEPPATT